MLNKKALSAAVQAAAGGATYVEDVFSTYLYGGNDTSQTITNGIDLSDEGGLVWIKGRDYAPDHQLVDTVRGATKYLYSNTTTAEDTISNRITAFNADGFSIGSSGSVNSNGNIYASWTFRKAEKFFDVVTYTGNGTTQTINHSLGVAPGMMMVKSLGTGNQWSIYHKDLGNTYGMWFTTAAKDLDTYWNNTSPTATGFTVGPKDGTNTNGVSYVAYLFAHDAGGFGEAGDQSVIKCGSYTGTGSALSVTLGWEPQFLIIKKATGTGADWVMTDNVRGLAMEGNGYNLYPNLTSAEATVGNTPELTPTGFRILTSDATVNAGGSDYIYIAIRRGPMKTPTDATKVFTPTVYTGTNVDNRLINTTIAPDFVMIRQRNDTVVPGMYTGARLTGQQFLITGSTNAGATDADSFDAQIVSAVEYGNAFSSMSGVWVGNDATRKFNANTTSNNHIIEAFKRAPGFFDVVCYTGTGSATTISHNLGVVPEMIWVKRRSVIRGWAVYNQSITATDFLALNLSDAKGTDSSYWNNTEPTSTVFTVNNSVAVNSSGDTYIALLFASCPGVSKVGSYTGNGTSQTIDCGFTNGVRFVLIKRTDASSQWYLFDSARGIVAGNDPYLRLSSTADEQTPGDVVDQDNTGFVIIEESNTNLNVTNGTYLYLAIA